MLAEFFTKPLQGTLFTRMRDKILNLPCSPAVHRSVLDLQDFSKGNKRDTTDGQEIIGNKDGNRDETANTPAQKPAQKNDKKDTQKDMKA